MNRAFVAMLGLLSLLAVACGRGDKKAAEPIEKPAATAEATMPKASVTVVVAEPTKRARGRASDGAGTVSSVFSSLFQTGASGGAGARGLGTGDESLKAFLPDSGDFPDGYAPFGSFTFSTPAESSDLGAMDMAMTMAMKGAPTSFAGDPSDFDLSSIEMVMAAVIKPEDLQALGDAFAQLEGLSAEDIQNEMDAAFGDMEGFEVKRFEVLDASGLGEGGMGMELTVDMSGLKGLIGGLAGGEGAPALGSMTMRMYVFARGDYVGAVMHFAFTDSLGGNGDDRDLAGVIDGKLTGVQGT